MVTMVTDRSPRDIFRYNHHILLLPYILISQTTQQIIVLQRWKEVLLIIIQLWRHCLGVFVLEEVF